MVFVVKESFWPFVVGTVAFQCLLITANQRNVYAFNPNILQRPWITIDPRLLVSYGQSRMPSETVTLSSTSRLLLRQQAMLRLYGSSSSSSTTTSAGGGNGGQQQQQQIPPLASEGDWSAFLDENGTGLIYYFNIRTGESRWEPPTSSFPVVTLTGRTRRLARDQRAKYLLAIQQQQEQEDSNNKNNKGGGGLLKTLLDESDGGVVPWPKSMSTPSTSTTTSSATATMTSSRTTGSSNNQDTTVPVSTKNQSKKEDNWFTSLFDDVVARQNSQDTPLGSASSSSSSTDKGRGSSGADTTTAPATTTTTLPWFSGDSKDVPTATTNKETTERPRFLEKLFAAPQLPDLVIPSKTVSIKESTLQQQQQQQKQQEANKIDLSRFATMSAPSTITVPPAKSIKIDISGYVLPHPSKVRWGGEDAIFVQGRTFGVFDGVSGADKLDGVPLYSRTLADEMNAAVGEEGLVVKDLVSKLSNAANVADQIATGASTAIVASICENGYLRAVNLGDSSCIVIRNGQLAFKTREVSHYFECPFQLSTDSPDRPRDGSKLNVELSPGDWVLMASDGIFDNLSDDDVVRLAMDGPKQPSAIAKRISDKARKVSLDRKASTPYAKLAQKNGVSDYKDGVGGKVDDISCVVVRYG